MEGRPPMTDIYTKIILTVIAACLVAFVVRLGCDGSPQAPCYVRLIQ
jgi:hypothetical protein